VLEERLRRPCESTIRRISEHEVRVSARGATEAERSESVHVGYVAACEWENVRWACLYWVQRRRNKCEKMKRRDLSLRRQFGVVWTRVRICEGASLRFKGQDDRGFDLKKGEGSEPSTFSKLHQYSRETGEEVERRKTRAATN
jgi:hypothetical protein